MKHWVVLGIAICLVAAPLRADPPKPEADPSLMERGAQLFMEGLLQQMEPTVDELRDMAKEMGPGLRQFTREMGPALADILGKVEDLSAYQPPEMLPNGDIIIRRKTPKDSPDEAPPEGEIEI